jgi:Ala-tRNA(Pro) deacylase
MTCKEQLEAYLRDQRAPFEIQHHRTTYTAHDTAVTEQIPDRMVAKVVIAVADEHLVMLVLPASSAVHMPRLRINLGARTVRLAHEYEFADRFPDCDTGAMPPFGQRYGLPVYVDRVLAANETIVFPAGTHTETIRMKYVDFAMLVRPIVADFGRARVIRAPRAAVAQAV